MNKIELQNQKLAIEQRYNELMRVKADTEDELRRLEGEHRLIVALSSAEENAPVEKGQQRMRKVKDAETKTNS